MKRALFAAAVILLLPAAGALAQERATDAALGAVSGAIVLGPIGAVAGAVVGYTAGPSIANSWGMRHSRASRSRHASAGRPASSGPPSRTSEVAATGGGHVAELGGSSTPSAQPASQPTPRAPATLPPVQGFE